MKKMERSETTEGGTEWHKLKQAEELSDLTSNTENVELQKKSRKVRAAKVLNSFLSNTDDLLEDTFTALLPKISKRSERSEKVFTTLHEKNNETLKHKKCVFRENNLHFDNREIAKRKQLFFNIIRQFHGDSVTDDQISEPVKIWLTHAKMRHQKVYLHCLSHHALTPPTPTPQLSRGVSPPFSP
ncbi:hypothetical protein PUN28_019712 [Cardiocondyla obscurior]|uniref:Uncharacterized protein n=1 Tax=Cardiocondyla obscurior TaxID=286306 RepID=A0AAW2EA59_9HYME